MKFAYTILCVENVNHTVAFYKQAFGLEKRFIHKSGQYAEMETGGTTLSFASNELAISNLPEGFQKSIHIICLLELKSLLRQMMSPLLLLVQLKRAQPRSQSRK